MAKRGLITLLSLIGSMTLVLSASCGLKSNRQPSLGSTQVASTVMPESPQTLIVFAAASLKEPFDQIGQAFGSKEPGVKVIMNYAGSQQLEQQIEQGAQVDVFASANQDQMDKATTAGFVQPESQAIFTRNRLVVIFPADNPAGITRLQDLEKDGLHLILAAPEVPVGQYTLEFLDKASRSTAFDPTFKDNVLANVMSYEENVKAVMSKVALGEADAGIVYVSDLSNANQVGRLEIPDDLNVIASYVVAPLLNSKDPKLAMDFVEFILSDQGQSILASYSFIPVK